MHLNNVSHLTNNRRAVSDEEWPVLTPYDRRAYETAMCHLIMEDVSMMRGKQEKSIESGE